MNYLNEKMTFHAISQCKREMKTFPTIPHFEKIQVETPESKPAQMEMSDLQSRRESNPLRQSNRSNHFSSKYSKF
jgi:hypothetical protein